ncbi:hypothetical protein JB92DRAFT_3109903 [Gautieria morchelliformis]|nr:hypothetical protein JB92DRAFT_3109903 [Gautieria morchelliformis]
MVEKNKHRLYITLQHRGGRPGYHWALLLAPTLKNETSDIREDDCHLFHATNSITPDHPPRLGGNAAWRFEDKPVNSLLRGDMVGRIIVAKFSPTVPLADLAKNIRMVVQHVRLIDDDPNWTCRVWVEEALDALRALGGEYSVIPEVTNRGAVEKKILAFGDEAMRRVRASTKDIKHVKDLLHKDMRVK